jgi:hypothetical protein
MCVSLNLSVLRQAGIAVDPLDGAGDFLPRRVSLICTFKTGTVSAEKVVKFSRA